MSMETITGILTPPGNIESFLGGTYPAFIRLVGYICVDYVMDEIWSGTNNLKFKKAVHLLLRSSCTSMFTVMIQANATGAFSG
jgi:hypothetical protein